MSRIPTKFVHICATQVSAYPILYALDEDGHVWENRFGAHGRTWDGWAPVSLTDTREEGY